MFMGRRDFMTVLQLPYLQPPSGKFLQLPMKLRVNFGVIPKFRVLGVLPDRINVVIWKGHL